MSGDADGATLVARICRKGGRSLYVKPTCTSAVLRDLFDSTDRVATRFGPPFM
ncbi:hypothetical protein [Ralstonia flatus]|uniref:hypothetical protein n=1 Tax=Ralstonia flatus TaxID=3058601 RepID=UPI00292D1D33|nr:hypothetical protein [Ralstonia sp. LMG 32965]